VVLAVSAYGGRLSCSEVALMYDTETTARHLKAGVDRVRAKLTTSEAAPTAEADRFEKAQRTWWEGLTLRRQRRLLSETQNSGAIALRRPPDGVEAL
jgi:hypothetical protein